VFVPNPLKYVLGLTMIISDTQFEEMPVSELFEFIDSDDDMVDFVKVGFENGFKVDLYHEYNDYDVMAYTTNDNLFPNKDDNLGDDETIVEDEGVVETVVEQEKYLENIDFHTEGEENAVLEKLPIDDPFLTKLVDPKFKAQTDVQYPSYIPDLPWKEFMPILGMKFENPQQLKHALADYEVANGHQLWYYRRDGNNLLVYCGRDMDMGRCAGRRVIREKKKEQQKQKANEKAALTIEQDFTRYMEQIRQLDPEAYRYLMERNLKGCLKHISKQVEVVPHLKMGYQRAGKKKRNNRNRKLTKKVLCQPIRVSASKIKWTRMRVQEHKGKSCPFRVWATWMSSEKSFQIKSLYPDHRLWSLSGVPCVHAVTAFLHFKLNPDDGVSIWGEKVAASRNVSSGANGGSGAKCGSGKKGGASKSVSARGAKSGASKSASGAKGGALKSASGAKGGASKSASGGKGGDSKSASGAKSVSVKRGAASGAKVAKRGAAKSNSAHSSMNTKGCIIKLQQ
ncbi:hypothetical protein Tco_1347365, partial [Tanacetum coccineum]